MIMRPVLFVDLDDTLFHSRRKIVDVLGEPVAFDNEGRPVSFMTARQRAFFEWLLRDAEVVVTTGRSAKAYSRVGLRLAGYAICSYGGLILQPDGQPERRWQERIGAEAPAHRHILAGLLDAVRSRAARAGVDARARTISEGDLDLYLSVKHNREDAGELARLAPTLADELPAGWRLCLNDNNLAVLPPFLGKELAVSWFLREIVGHHAFVLGVGDSLSDLPFMALCDYALTPSSSQLFSSLLARTS
jgi:hydroxymethylpyrimidine pyrophosphatase-like HAD family hydrolase